MNYVLLGLGIAAGLVAFFAVANVFVMSFAVTVRANTDYALQWLLGYIVIASVTAPLALWLITTAIPAGS